MFIASMAGSSAHIADRAGLAPIKSPAATNTRFGSSRCQAASAPDMAPTPPACKVTGAAAPGGVKVNLEGSRLP